MTPSPPSTCTTSASGAARPPASARSMRIAFCSYGFEEYSVRIATALSREARISLWLAEQGVEEPRGRLSESVAFQTFHPFQKPRLRQPLRQLKTGGRLVNQIRKFDPHVVHVQHGHLWFNFFLPLLRRFPLVLTIHDPRHHVGDRASQKTPQAVLDYGFRQADEIIVHGHQQKAEVVEQLRLPRDRIHVIPHVALGNDGAGTEVAEEDHLVLFFGRIWEYKGLEYLIRAEPLITSRIPAAKIVIAGTGEPFDRYRRLMQHPDRFEVHNGYVSDDERTALFRRASVVVLPYVEATQSGVIPLAYTFSKPVIATAVGGLPEMVDHERTGILVPPRDERALADAVVSLLADPDRRRALGANGKRKLDGECAPEVVAAQTLAVYRQAVAHRRSA